MPLRIRWKSKEYLGFALILLGACGMFQVLFIYIAQYFFLVGNYFVVMIIPIGVTGALFLGTIMIFESYAQIERREKFRSQFVKNKRKENKLRKIFRFPIVKPLIIIFIFFTITYLITYIISLNFLDSVISFLIAENLATIFCLLIANYYEKYYTKVQRY